VFLKIARNLRFPAISKKTSAKLINTLSITFFMNIENVKIVVFVPLIHSDIVRKAIGDVNEGMIGNYSHCSFSSRGIGRFKPNEKANPHIGKANKLEEVEEEKIEVICPRNAAKKVINAIKKVHPYEEVALDIYPLINESNL